MNRSKRYRNFILEGSLQPDLQMRAKLVRKCEKDGVQYYHIAMPRSYSENVMRTLAKTTHIYGITKPELLEYYTVECVENVTFGLAKVKYDMERFQHEYDEKLKRGKLLYDVITTDNYSEDILPSYEKECLCLYTNHLRKTEDLGEVTLLPWQTELLTSLENPTDRKVIWIYGTVGQEGKTWLQNYIEKCYGSRVYRGVLTHRADNMCYALSKQLLPIKDIFIFNIARSDNNAVNNSDAYQVIEGIKDGCYLSGKYSSQQLHFNTPNTVLVFANKPPEAGKLSKDRWIVYHITSDLKLARDYKCLEMPVKSKYHSF